MTATFTASPRSAPTHSTRRARRVLHARQYAACGLATAEPFAAKGKIKVITQPVILSAAKNLVAGSGSRTGDEILRCAQNDRLVRLRSYILSTVWRERIRPAFQRLQTFTARRRVSGALLPAGAASLIALALYLRTLAPAVLVGDSGEFQFTGYILGVPHPTGYPLYTLLNQIFTWLPVGDVAYRVNLSSAVYAALACGLVAAIVYHLAAGAQQSFAIVQRQNPLPPGEGSVAKC